MDAILLEMIEKRAKKSPTAPITINDIARLAGVSKKTVSRVINNSPEVIAETRNLVNAVIEETGYSPNPHARGLASRRSFLIGLIFDNPNAEFVVNAQYGALDGLRDSGYELIAHPCDRKNPQLITQVSQFVERHKLHGAILLPPVSENTQLVEAMCDLSCKVVSFASIKIKEATYCAISNDRQSATEVAEHFVRLGHKRIGVVTGPSSHQSSNERLTGFMNGLAAHGIDLADPYIARGGYTFESGMQAAESLLTLDNKPTAIFACNDEMAAGIYQTAHRLGISIPDQLSIVGFDDSQIAQRLWPPLTTIKHPAREMARIAASHLIRPASSNHDQVIMFAVPHLVVRSSTHSQAT